jgi:hypothetical protein
MKDAARQSDVFEGAGAFPPDFDIRLVHEPARGADSHDAIAVFDLCKAAENRSVDHGEDGSVDPRCQGKHHDDGEGDARPFRQPACSHERIGYEVGPHDG